MNAFGPPLGNLVDHALDVSPGKVTDERGSDQGDDVSRNASFVDQDSRLALGDTETRQDQPSPSRLHIALTKLSHCDRLPGFSPFALGIGSKPGFTDDL